MSTFSLQQQTKNLTRIFKQMAEAKPVPSAMASPKWLQLRPKGQEEVQMLSPRGITTENACPTVKHWTEMKKRTKKQVQ